MMKKNIYLPFNSSRNRNVRDYISNITTHKCDENNWLAKMVSEKQSLQCWGGGGGAARS